MKNTPDDDQTPSEHHEDEPDSPVPDDETRRTPCTTTTTVVSTWCTQTTNGRRTATSIGMSARRVTLPSLWCSSELHLFDENGEVIDEYTPYRSQATTVGVCWSSLTSSERQSQSQSPSMSDDTTEFPPEKRLEPPNPRLIRAGITTIHDMETLRACVGYENANQRRQFVLDLLASRAQELRDQDEDDSHDEYPVSQSQSQDGTR